MSNYVLLFPEAMRLARKKAKLTQAELAKKIGVSLMSVRRYEAGEYLPDMRTLEAMCVVLTDEYLSEAWTNSMNEPAIEPESTGVVYKVKHRDNIGLAIKRHYWKDLVDRGHWSFIYKLIDTAQCYQKMNREGVEKALEIIQLLSKIPEYQTETSWAYKDDYTEEESDHAKEANNNTAEQSEREEDSEE